MAKAKTKNRKRNTDGDDLIDDDAATVAVAEKPERKARETTKKQDANQRKTGPAASKRAEAKAKKAGKANWDRAAREGKAAADAKKDKTSKSKSKATSKPKASSSGKRPRTTVVHKAPKAGSKFTAKYKGKTHTMTVKTVKGETVYVVKGKAYKSPSSAARSVITAGQKNGWTFWSIE